MFQIQYTFPTAAVQFDRQYTDCYEILDLERFTIVQTTLKGHSRSIETFKVPRGVYPPKTLEQDSPATSPLLPLLFLSHPSRPPVLSLPALPLEVGP